MLALCERGNQSARVKSVSRLRAAALAVLMSGGLGLSMTQFGCDTETGKANKSLYMSVEKAGEQTRTKTDAEAVAELVRQSPVTDAAKAVEALTPLSAYDSTRPESLGEWNTAARQLTIFQREAIGQALRSVAIEDRKKEIEAMAAAAKTANASPEAAVDPLLRLATLEGAAADAIQQEASNYEIQAARLVDDAHRLLAQIKLNNATVAEYKLREPVDTLANLDQQQQKMSGSAPDAVWFPGTAEASVPAKSQVEANASAAQAQLDKLTEERKQQVAQATQFRQEAAKLSEEANKDAGDIAYNKLIEASKLRQQATMLDLEVQKVDGQIMKAQHELMIADARKPTIEEAINTMDLRKTQVQERWKSVQDLIAQVEADTKRIVVGSDPSATPATQPLEATLTKPGDVTPTTQPASESDLKKIAADNYLAAKLQQLQTTVAIADDLRGRASDLYQEALKHLKDAADVAGTARANVKERKDLRPKGAGDLSAFEARLDQLDEARFAYRDAELRQRLARLYADKAIGIAVRNDLRNQAVVILQAAGIEPAPDAVTALPQSTDVQQAAAKADEAFAEVSAALTPFLGATTGDGPDYSNVANADSTRGRLTKAAMALMVNATYARSQVLAICGDKSADDKVKAAQGYARNYQQNFEQLPRYLPGPLAVMMNVAPTAMPSLAATPTSGPAATGPATTGTDPGTPMFNPDGTPAAPTPPAPGVPTPPTPTPPPAAGVPADWVQHNVPNTTFSFKAPPAWTVEPSQTPDSIRLMSDAGDNTGISVTVSPALAGETLDSIVTSVPAQMQEILPEFKLVSAAVTTIGGQQAAEIVFDSTVDGTTTRTLQIDFLLNGSKVEVAANTPAGGYDAVAPTLKQIAGTVPAPAGGAPAPAPAPAPIPAPPPGTDTPAPPPPPGDDTVPAAPTPPPPPEE